MFICSKVNKKHTYASDGTCIYCGKQVSISLLDSGSSVNLKMKQLAGNDYTFYANPDTNITTINTYVNSDAPSDLLSVAVSSEDSPNQIYATYSDGVISLYTSADVIVMNATSSYMFYDCESLTNISGLSEWVLFENINLYQMFYNCLSLVDISPLSKWNAGNITSMGYMFGGCTLLIDLTPLTDWDVSNVTNIASLFRDNTSLVNISPLADWDVSNVTTIGNIFNGCTSLVDASCLENWNVSKVTTFTSAFPDICTSLPSWYS